MVKRIVEKVKRGWHWVKRKVRSWLVSLLVMLGITVGGIVYAQSKDFNWQNPTANVDGTAFDAATELKETRIYCGGDPALFVPEEPNSPQSWSPTVVAPNAAQTVTSNFGVGEHTCFATSFSIYGYESTPSNTVTFVVTPTVAPNPPANFTVNE